MKLTCKEEIMYFSEFCPAANPVYFFMRYLNAAKVLSKYLLVIIVLVNCVQAQQQAFVQWSEIYRDSVHPYFAVWSSALDKHHNFYTTGEIQTAGSPNPVWQITTVRFSDGGVPTLFDCYEPATKQTLFGADIIVDDSGASYVAGIRYPTNSSSEGILLKYSPNGHIDWVKHYPCYPYSCQVVLGSTGEIYLGINTDQGISVWKLDRSGVTIDSILISDSVNIEGRSILSADSGNVFIVGNRSYTRTYGESPMPVLYNDALIIKLDSHCRIIWEKVFLNKEVIVGLRDKLNNIVVLGREILSKYSSEGDSLWQKNTDNNTTYTGLDIDSRNRIIIVGIGASEFPHDAAVMYDLNGSVLWRQTLSNFPRIEYFAVTLDSADNIYITGDLSENPNGILCLTTKLDTAGNQIWKTTFKAPGYLYNIGRFVTLDDSANVYIGSSSSTQYTAGYSVIKYKQISSTDIVKPLGIALDYSLAQNYPNPFNPTTTIIYSLPKSSLVTLEIYDILGRRITTLVNGEKRSGTYKVIWNARNIPSGIYFYKISVGGYSRTNKMILLK